MNARLLNSRRERFPDIKLQLHNPPAFAALLRSAVLALGGLLLFTEPAFAARQQVECTIEAGFDGVVGRNATIFPVTVTIRNRIGSTSGEIRIIQPDAAGKYDSAHILPFESPSPSTKKFVMLARNEQNRAPEINIRFADYILPVSRKLDCQISQQDLVLCCGIPSAMRYGITSNNCRFITIKAAQIPADPMIYDSARALMLGSAAFMGLQRDQLQALRAWIQTGGALVLSGAADDNVFRSNLEFLTAGSGIKPAGTGAWELGCGVLAIATAETGGTGFWEENKALTTRLFHRDPARATYYGREGLFTQLWSAQRGMSWLGGLVLIIIVVSYILVAGPLDMHLVRKYGKQHLTWTIFLSSIVLFSFIAYSYSNFVNVTSMRTVCANVMDAPPFPGQARCNSQIWIYSPRNTTYTVRPGVQNAFLSTREGSGGVGYNVAPVDIVNGTESAIAARIPVYSSREFDATWYTPWNHTVSVTTSGKVVRVKVPAELQVKTAAVVNRNTFMWLHKDGAGWASDGTTPWFHTVMNDAIATAKPYGYSFRGNSEYELLPSDKILLNYLLCLSFGETAGTPSDNATAHMGDRERRHSICDRLDSTPGTLLLFLEQGSTLLPLNVSREFPDKARADLVRIQLPPWRQNER